MNSSKAYQEQVVSLFVDPQQLRAWADRFEFEAKEQRVGDTLPHAELQINGNLQQRLMIYCSHEAADRIRDEQRKQFKP